MISLVSQNKTLLKDDFCPDGYEEDWDYGWDDDDWFDDEDFEARYKSAHRSSSEK